MNDYIDTHCHYDLPPLLARRWELLRACRAAGVRAVIVPAITAGSNRTMRAALDYAQNPALLSETGCSADDLPRLFFAAGLHPARLWGPDALPPQQWEPVLREAAAAPGCVAIGETGLDHHLPFPEPGLAALQADCFSLQLCLAEELRLPLILHIRDAYPDALALLRQHPLREGGVVHCFTADWDTARRFLDLGLSLGIGGAVTREGADALRDAVRRCPADRLVLETDGPYVKPAGWTGPNSSLSIPGGIARFTAELRGVPEAELAGETTRNARALFHL